MQAHGPILIEHRLIMKMLDEIQLTLENVTITQSIDSYFVDTAVDFIQVYADRTHHGKEEDILFKELRKKNLTKEDLQMMDELIEDHCFCRITTRALIEANNHYRRGNETSLNEVTTCLKTLVNYYPKHIKKETNVFFPATQNYFSDGEDQAMIADFFEFDRIMIHEKYIAVVNESELKRKSLRPQNLWVDL